MTTLAEYMQAEGLTDEEMAERISERLGRPIKPVTVRANRYRGLLPKAWVSALGLEDADPASGGAGAGDATRSAERAPRMPRDGVMAPTPALLTAVAKERITATYETVGFAVSKLTEQPGIKVVTDDYAPAIADAWIRAADESEFARRVVRLISSGGAVGELVTVHLIWLLGIAYVTGRVDDPTGLLARKYQAYHDAAVHAASAGAEAVAGNGSQPARGQGADDAVGESAAQAA